MEVKQLDRLANKVVNLLNEVVNLVFTRWSRRLTLVLQLTLQVTLQLLLARSRFATPRLPSSACRSLVGKHIPSPRRKSRSGKGSIPLSMSSSNCEQCSAGLTPTATAEKRSRALPDS